MSLDEPHVNDRSIAIDVGVRCFLRDAFKYQHCERVRVGIHRWEDTAAFEELDG